MPKKVKEPATQKVYANMSICCMTVTNPFREKILAIVMNAWFDRYILLVIMANCVFLAIDDPSKEALNYQIVADYVFLVIYTLEMVLKIIAMGFVLRPLSYLRDAWNIVRFSIDKLIA